MKHLALPAAALLALAGCADPVDPTRGSFRTEAGQSLNDGGFGNATMSNTLAMSGDSTYTMNLARRFAAEVPTTINFAFNSYALDDESRSVLRAQADWIRQFPEVRFKVFGHTDLVGTPSYNQRLGLRRAEAAVLYLVSQGIERSRLEAVVSHGQNQPLVMTDQPERANRRTVTEVTGFVASNPGIMNGRYAEVVFREYVASATSVATIGGITGELTSGSD